MLAEQRRIIAAEEYEIPVPMESWKYGNPEDIADGLIARTERMERAEARKDDGRRVSEKMGITSKAGQFTGASW